MFGPIRAVAVDDEQSHLLAITTGLSASGIPCMGYWYDKEAHSLRPEPDEGGLPFLRLVFMDLNLEELGGVPDAATLCGNVMPVLKQLISKNGGPYSLIFWTQIGTKVEEVRKLLYERLEGIPFPMAVVELPKGKFIGAGPKEKNFKEGLQEFYSDLHSNTAALGKAVRDAVVQEPALYAVSSWESRASEAAARAVNEIFACAKADVTDPAKTAGSIQKVLAKIAAAAAGERAAREFPARSLDAGMVDILTDQFGISVEDTDYQDVIQKAIGETLKSQVVFQDPVQMFAELNTFFHIDTEVGSAKAGDRGVVVSAKPFSKGDLGFRPDDLLTAEFLFPWETFPPERQAEIKHLIAEFSNAAEFVLVELGADCDHAQDISRTRRYLLGLEVPVKFFELAQFHENKKLRSESLQLLGPWSIGGAVSYLLVSCGRFWTWQQRKPHVQGKVKYRLRASIVNKLLHHYTAWSSRPGIIEFR